MADMTVDVGKLRLKNPVMPASGTFSEGLAQVFNLNVLGAVVLKTITRELREGNPLPRVAEVRSGLLNSIGIPSKGVADFKEKVLPFYSTVESPLVASISAPTPDLFASLAVDLSVPGVAAIELNLSCPNIEQDGRSFAMSEEATHAVVARVRAATTVPLWVKLTPNTGDIVAIARVAEDAGADALVVANTILAMAIDVHKFQFRLGNVVGGLSGPAIKNIILRQVYQCAQAIAIPIIGCGGISNAEDAVEYLLAGATAVQVGTATFTHPSALPTIIRDLEQFCDAHGIGAARNLTGILSRASRWSLERDLQRVFS
jgi:dihydroorotate dehydrogenase (NAD+) catalytic subunit